ncbi:MAG: Tellurium resistance protein TerA [Alphaproteobacteria bacterium]|nr:Tellurium resistance protein TerA [Alphaproteobacteria bacterium]
MSDPKNSLDSIIEANRYRVEYSGHGNALGAAGHREVSYDSENCEYLREPGQSIAVSPGEKGFQSIQIGVMWDNVEVKKSGLIGKLLKKTMKVGVDLDLGILYELQDGTRGCLQAFGNKFGDFANPPYMKLSGDERTGNSKGQDESILVNGTHWDKVARILVYLYIYNGAPNWAGINPKIVVDVPGENDLVVSLGAHDDTLCLCAVGGLENARGGIKLTNYTEYFPGHEEMDRAFGFGLEWGEGIKS